MSVLFFSVEASSGPPAPQYPGQLDGYGEGNKGTVQCHYDATCGMNDRLVSLDSGQSIFIDPQGGNFTKPGPARYVTNNNLQTQIIPISTPSEWLSFLAGSKTGTLPSGDMSVIACRPQSQLFCSSSMNGMSQPSLSYKIEGSGLNGYAQYNEMSKSYTAQCSGYSETKTFICSQSDSGVTADGIWQENSVNDVVTSCPGSSINWGACQGNYPTMDSDTTFLVTNLVAGYSGTATLSCHKGQIVSSGNCQAQPTSPSLTLKMTGLSGSWGQVVTETWVVENSGVTPAYNVLLSGLDWNDGAAIDQQGVSEIANSCSNITLGMGEKCQAILQVMPFHQLIFGGSNCGGPEKIILGASNFAGKQSGLGNVTVVQNLRASCP
jgi:hypothetical protein